MGHLWHYLGMGFLFATCLLGINPLFGTTWRALVCDVGTSEVYPIDLGSTPVAELPVSVSGAPSSSVITPDATWDVVTTVDASPPNPEVTLNNIFGLDMTTNPISVAIGRTIATLSGPIAMTPDGTNVYVIDEAGDIIILQARDLSFVASIPQYVFGTYTPAYIALSPNESRGYITTNDTKVFVIDTDTNTLLSTSYTFAPGTQTGAISITPDGSELYIGDMNSPDILYIVLSNGGLHTISGAQYATTNGLAISSDGAFVYAVQDTQQTYNFLTKVSTATHAVVAEFQIPGQLILPALVAITPDGAVACITDAGEVQSQSEPGQYVAILDTESGTSVVSPLQLSTSDVSALLGVTITPDQAPTARFTHSTDRTTVTFDASSSSSPVGGIATFAWDFGDGQTATTSSPIITHTYIDGGTFAVVLTVTNTAGTSTTVTYTGQVVSNNGGPSAVESQQITIPRYGIESFEGEIVRKFNGRKVFLKTWWSKSLLRHAKKFVLYAREKKVAVVKAHHRREKTLNLHLRSFPLTITERYRHYLDHKYSIRVFDHAGHVSQPTFIHVKH